MSDFDPNASLTLNMADGREVRMGRHNSGLFTFVGQNALGEDNALRNHVYVQYKVEDEPTGAYIFACSPVFKNLAQFILVNDFPAALNHNDVPENDEAAYQAMLDKHMREEAGDLGDFPPEWSDGQPGAA